MSWTAQITDHNLANPEGTDVRHFATKRDVLIAWTAGYFNTHFCLDYWGADLPAMSDAFTVTVWIGQLDDVTDVYPDAEVTLGRQGGPVWRKIA